MYISYVKVNTFWTALTACTAHAFLMSLMALSSSFDNFLTLDNTTCKYLILLYMYTIKPENRRIVANIAAEK